MSEKQVGNFVDDILDQLPNEPTEHDNQLSEHAIDMIEQAKLVAQSVDASVIADQIRQSLMHPVGLEIMKKEVWQMHPHLTKEQIDGIFVPENFEQLVQMGVMAATQMKQM
uniref:Uncharacterized protein n=1 Tax=Clandestinovirus TaxID=2831644 RepID=A0A8F8PMR2_9VIRU|nr:hypothetical protein KOM_12_502 [Clandestinovirus]